MDIQLKILRFTPGKHRRPRFRMYTLDVGPNDRVVDLLERVRTEQDATLAFRRSCKTGMCGSDAMRINGRNTLACKTRVSNLGSGVVTIEPLPGLAVIKDLVVDMRPFFELYQRVQPFWGNSEPPGGLEHRQSASDRLRIEDTIACIQCGVCTTACPVWMIDHSFTGPAALVAAFRYFYDTRDRLKDSRKESISGEDNIWRCRNAYNCTDCCPQLIPITRSIAEMRRSLIGL